MKKIILAIVSVIGSVGLLAQGTINFSSTYSSTGGPVDGDAYLGKVWVNLAAGELAVGILPVWRRSGKPLAFSPILKLLMASSGQPTPWWLTGSRVVLRSRL